MPTQPSRKATAKAASGKIGSRSAFQRHLREAGAEVSPEAALVLQYNIERYAVAIAAARGITVRGSVNVGDAAAALAAVRGDAVRFREEARGDDDAC